MAPERLMSLQGSEPVRRGRPSPPWTLLTSHGLVLFYVSLKPDATIREISDQLGFTDRRVNDIIRDLAAENLVQVNREGRKNRYTLSPDARFVHPIMAELTFESFVALWRHSRPELEPSDGTERS